MSGIVALTPVRIIEVRVMVFNATFNNISVISWLSVLLVKETGVVWKKKLMYSLKSYV